MSELTKDRKKILYLTSRMFDNPDPVGLYPTTEFYDDMEGYIKSIRNDYEEQISILQGKSDTDDFQRRADRGNLDSLAEQNRVLREQAVEDALKIIAR